MNTIGFTIIGFTLAVVFFAAWVCERRRKDEFAEMLKNHLQDSIKNCEDLIRQLNNERTYSDTIANERNEALAKCEQLADENASLASDVAKLHKCTVAYVFSDWERIEDVTDVRDYYLEKEGVRIIIEDGKATSGFYSKDGPGEYIKPVAEVIDSDIV